MTETTLPERPLDRFLELLDALLADKKWTEGVAPLRYAASTLMTMPGDAPRVARDLRRIADELLDRAGWFGPLKSPARFAVAAILLRSGIDAATFTDEVTRVDGLFKERGLKRRSVLSCLAILLLFDHARREGRRVDGPLVSRFGQVYEAMASHHGFLTGLDDYPACALLAGLDGTPSDVARRCERFYDGLRDLGFRRGNALQSVSHMLVFAPEADDVVMRRFRALYDAFDKAGLWMNTGDYDEVAALSFLDRPAATVVSTTLRHREVLAKHKPRPGRELSFSLACGTAFLELAGGGADERLRGTQNVLAIQAILQAQQAAMIAAVAASSAAAASSASSGS